jgi:excisionase family DNA binding protein
MLQVKFGGTMTKADEGQRLLTCAATARHLGLKEATIRVWVARRRLPSVKLGRAVRIPAEAVEDLIRLNTVPARG